MRLSKKKIDRALHLYRHPEDVEALKKYQLLEELKMYGITVDPNSDIDSSMLKEFLHLVVCKVYSKYIYPERGF